MENNKTTSKVQLEEQSIYAKLPPAKWFTRLLWECAGADKQILSDCTYADRVKWFCLGGIVLATGVMAALAGGYAFYTIFSPKTSNVLNETKMLIENNDLIAIDKPTAILSIIFGIIWGYIIFNLDRFIISSTGKGDGAETITKSEFINSIPRLFMATVIAITISKPIEIRMFKTEIDLAVQKQQNKEKETGIEQANKNFSKKVSDIKIKLGKIQSEIDSKENAIADLRSEISKEITGKNGNGAAYGPRAAELERIANIMENQLNTLKKTPEYISALVDMKKFEEEKKDDMQKAEINAASLDGLLIRIQLAHEIAGFWISLFITLLFWTIEVAPIFFKMMMIKSPYDYLDENHKLLIIARNGIQKKGHLIGNNEIKDKYGNQINTAVELEFDKFLLYDKIVLEKIKLINSEMEIKNHIIDKHILSKKEDIDINPNKYTEHEETEQNS
jgi:hypothetical protein